MTATVRIRSGMHTCFLVRAVLDETNPTLALFAAPRGFRSVPWDGPAGLT
jgi:hypothetical protein